MAAPARFERTAYRLGGDRSIRLSYGAYWGINLYPILKLIGKIFFANV